MYIFFGVAAVMQSVCVCVCVCINEEACMQGREDT